MNRLFWQKTVNKRALYTSPVTVIVQITRRHGHTLLKKGIIYLVITEKACTFATAIKRKPF